MGLPVLHLGMIIKATVQYVARWSKIGIRLTFMLQGEYLNFSAWFKKNVLFEQNKLSFETNQASFWIQTRLLSGYMYTSWE